MIVMMMVVVVVVVVVSTVCDLSSMMFWVLRSRWRMLALWICCNDSTICTNKCTTSPSSNSSYVRHTDRHLRIKLHT